VTKEATAGVAMRYSSHLESHFRMLSKSSFRSRKHARERETRKVKSKGRNPRFRRRVLDAAIATKRTRRLSRRRFSDSSPTGAEMGRPARPVSSAVSSSTSCLRERNDSADEKSKEIPRSSFGSIVSSAGRSPFHPRVFTRCSVNLQGR